jgi:hypothetical protein
MQYGAFNRLYSKFNRESPWYIGAKVNPVHLNNSGSTETIDWRYLRIEKSLTVILNFKWLMPVSRPLNKTRGYYMYICLIMRSLPVLSFLQFSLKKPQLGVSSGGSPPEFSQSMVTSVIFWNEKYKKSTVYSQPPVIDGTAHFYANRAIATNG